MHKHWVAIDIETLADETALPFLEPPSADKRLKDAEKIAQDIADKTAAQRDRMSLDPYAGRIVCIGWQKEQDSAPDVLVCRTEDEERAALRVIAAAIRDSRYQAVQRHVVGYRILGFDWPWLVTRARLLEVRFPVLDTRKFGNRDITDVWSLLTFDGALPDGAFPRRLKTLARRFGVTVADPTNGADVAQLARDGQWDAIAAHCKSDVALTVALAERVGVLELTAQEAF